MDKDTKDHLHRQLIKLGDMMGDGLHHEPDGKWIEKEYRRVAKALGYIKPKPRANNSKAINEAMEKILATTSCPKCNGQLKQTRSGSKRAQCVECQAKFQLKTKRERK
ncbi:hypothetical protein PAQ92_004683 [Vibrio parahaemolyticus]|nr:hypothetical protein [Vibrio parahaemolyticus]